MNMQENHSYRIIYCTFQESNYNRVNKQKIWKWKLKKQIMYGLLLSMDSPTNWTQTYENRFLRWTIQKML